MPDRLSLKWIHGNTNATVPTVPPGATYDVDDPTMWPPLSVLSGLASGFCERRAVLNPDFVTATGTTTTWVQEGDAGEAARNTIVTNFMNNLAAGTTNYANMFYAKDVTMSGMSAGAVNYMNSFDSALCRLICVAGNSPETYKADINGTPYGTTDAAAFGTLATAAYNTAAAATSAITTPVKNGGTTLKRQFGIALPVEWAKERKWMLDELKYTDAVVTYNPYDLNCDTLNQNVARSANGIEACRALSYTGMTQDNIYLTDDSVYCYSTAREVADWWQLGRTFVVVAKHETGATSWTIPYTGYEWPKGTDATNAIYFPGTTTCVAGATYTIHATFGQGTLYKAKDINQQSFSYSEKLEVVTTGQVSAQGTATNETAADITSAEYTNQNIKCYEVKDGATLVVPNGKQPYSILVSSGGTVSFENGGRAETCIVLEGGTITGIPNVATGLGLNGFYPLREFDYSTNMGVEDFSVRFRIPRIGSSYSTITGATTYTSDTHKVAVFVGYGDTLTIDTDTSNKLRAVTIGSGGSVVISGTANTRAICESATITALPGGSLNCSRYYKLDTCDVVVYPGASATLYEDVYDAHSEPSTRVHVAQNATLTVSRSTASVRFEAKGIMYFSSDGFSGDGAYPVIQENNTTPTTHIFKHIALMGFNGNGIVLNGNTESVVEGLNEATTTITNSTDRNNNTVQGIAHVDETLLPLTTENIPPTTGRFIGEENTTVMYRCSLISCELTPGTGQAVDNNYTTFKVRQFDPPA